MSEQSFAITFTVPNTPQQVFDAISDVRSWWSTLIDGASGRPGDEFSYEHADPEGSTIVHRSRIKVTEAVPGRRIAWEVLDNQFSFTEDQGEWTGTTIAFDIAEQGERTELRFVHHGLGPAFECYDACSDGWTFYINRSLRSRITTGEGFPNGINEPELSPAQ